jgi:hypothetical protein
MEDQTGQKPDVAEHRRPLRPKYKGRSMTWRRLFITTAVLCALLTYLLVIALKGNAALQRVVYGNKVLTTTGK